MGQYWLPVNISKKEYIHPHKLACGLKLWEQLAGDGVGKALVVLLAAMPEQRGGGDLEENPVVGRWAGDRIAFIGDYAEEGDITPPIRGFNPKSAWNKIHPCDKAGNDLPSKWVDVTDLVIPVIEHELDVKFEGDGWRQMVSTDPQESVVEKISAEVREAINSAGWKAREDERRRIAAEKKEAQ